MKKKHLKPFINIQFVSQTVFPTFFMRAYIVQPTVTEARFLE